MARRTRRYWTHGVATIVEFPERTSLIRHAGWGTQVRQPAGGPTNNWFHIAVPTLTRLKRDDSILLDDIRILIDLNQNALLREVHVLHGRDLLAVEQYSLSNGQFEERFELPQVDIDFGLAISVRIEFLDGTPEGEVIFRGAAANYARFDV